MWLLTVPLAIIGVFAIEAAGGRLLPRAWRWLRWSVLPPLGVLLAAGMPILLRSEVPWFDGWLVVMGGAAMGVIAATWGGFRPLLQREPELWDLNATGMRSALLEPPRR